MLDDNQLEPQTAPGEPHVGPDALFMLGKNPRVGGKGDFDYPGLLARVYHDRSAAAEIVAVFLEDAPRLLAAVQAAGRPRDAGQVRRAAHALNGASATVGARLIRERAAWLEMHADIADTLGITRVIDSLYALFVSFRDATQRALAADA